MLKPIHRRLLGSGLAVLVASNKSVPAAAAAPAPAAAPSDLMILCDNRQTANQVIGLAFDIARSHADLLAKQPATKAAAGEAAQGELASDQAQLAKARADLVWREINVILPARVDHAAAKERLSAAASDVLKDEREEILRQTREIQRATASTAGGDAQRRVQLRFSATGAEAHIRYPVRWQNAAEMDERVSQSVFAALSALSADSTTPARPA